MISIRLICGCIKLNLVFSSCHCRKKLIRAEDKSYKPESLKVKDCKILCSVFYRHYQTAFKNIELLKTRISAWTTVVALTCGALAFYTRCAVNHLSGSMFWLFWVADFFSWGFLVLCFVCIFCAEQVKTQFILPSSMEWLQKLDKSIGGLKNGTATVEDVGGSNFEEIFYKKYVVKLSESEREFDNLHRQRMRRFKYAQRLFVMALVCLGLCFMFGTIGYID